MQPTSWPVAGGKGTKTNNAARAIQTEAIASGNQTGQSTYNNFRGSGLWLLGNHCQGLPSFMIGRLDLVVWFVIFIERIQRENTMSTIVHQTDSWPQTQAGRDDQTSIYFHILCAQFTNSFP